MDHRSRYPARRGPPDDAGVATLTLVLIIPAVVFLVATVAQFVVYYHASHLATAAAQETARTAQLADGSEAAARAHGEDFLAQAGPRLVLDPEVLVTRDTASQVARAEVRGRAPQLVPGLPTSLSAEASGPIEYLGTDQ